jgi:hypothetical protein
MATSSNRASDRGSDRGGERKSGKRSESPTGGPSQTSDRKPLDRDPTEEGSAGKDREA